MILINKADNTTSLYTNMGDVGSSEVTLHIISDYEDSTFDVALKGTDTSSYPDRYNKFTVSVSLFSLLKPGLYLYEVKAPNVLETGYLRIIEPDTDPIELSDNTSPFIVYSN